MLRNIDISTSFDKFIDISITMETISMHYISEENCIASSNGLITYKWSKAGKYIIIITSSACFYLILHIKVLFVSVCILLPFTCWGSNCLDCNNLPVDCYNLHCL